MSFLATSRSPPEYLHSPSNNTIIVLSHPQYTLHTFSLNGGSVAEWLACWTQAQYGLGSNRSPTLSSNSLRQTVHTHCASADQAAKLAAALLSVARVTAGLAESNGSLQPGL